MSNHLHEFMESKIFGVPSQAKDLSLDCVVERSVLDASESVSFWMGSVNEFLDMTLVKDLVRLPFEKCWFECVWDRPGKNVVIGQIVREENSVIVSDVYQREKDKWNYMFTWDQHECDDIHSARLINFHKDDEGLNLGVAHVVISGLKNFLQAINCTNINRIEHKPSEKLQKARAKRGKKPLFSYWTLEIDLPKSRAAGEDYGGTHASPRLHLRRGHPRQYAPGKYCWVQPHVVGNKAAGMVHKDYAAKYAHA